MITLIGVGHVFKLDPLIKKAIRDRRPDVVCLELDPERWEALRTGQTGGGGGSPILQLLSIFQKRIAAEYDTEVGREMLAAAEAAGEVGARLALIDRHIEDTVRDLFGRMGIAQKLFMLAGAAAALLFVRKGTVEKEMRKMEEDDEYIEKLAAGKGGGGGFPMLNDVWKVLIDSRNDHMSAEVAKLATQHPRLVVVVGDGHVPGLVALLRRRDLPLEVIRLKQLRAGTVPEPGGAAVPEGTNASVSVNL